MMSVNNINCCVPGCHSRKGRTPHLSFHQFPKLNEALVYITNKQGLKEKIDKCKAWAMALKMKKPTKKYMKVCSLHFNKDDYILPDMPTKKPRLKLCAVPTRSLPQSTIIPRRNLNPKLKTTIVNKRKETTEEIPPDNNVEILTIIVEKDTDESMDEISIKDEDPETIESIFIEEPASTIINELFIKDEFSLGHDDVIIKEDPIG